MVNEIAPYIAIYQIIIALGVVLSGILLFVLHKNALKLPEKWRKSLPLINFQRSIFLLMIYLVINLICEIISYYLARHHAYNSFVLSINMTLSTPFLFGFLFINTFKSWKRYSYIILYGALVAYFITGGYYHPRSVLGGNSSLIMSTICFLGALIHLTDLLINPKSDYFKFQLKITTSFLIFNLLSNIFSSFCWFNDEFSTLYFEPVFYIHLSNATLFYLSFMLFFIIEIRKLQRPSILKKQ